MRPDAVSTAATARAQSSSLVTFTVCADAGTPAAVSFATAAASASALMSSSTTAAPSRPRYSATPKPMPCAPPVTSAV